MIILTMPTLFIWLEKYRTESRSGVNTGLENRASCIKHYNLDIVHKKHKIYHNLNIMPKNVLWLIIYSFVGPVGYYIRWTDRRNIR